MKRPFLGGTLEIARRLCHPLAVSAIALGRKETEVFIVPLPDPLAIAISILLMATTIVASARVVLGVRPPPVFRALFIAAVSNLLGKLLVTGLHRPAPVAYGIPTAAFLVLSHRFFAPTPARLVAYWLAGFALYLVLHAGISLLFGWTFMFPFWKPGIRPV